MHIMNTTTDLLIGIYQDMNEARGVVDHLRRSGIPDTELAILSSGDYYPEKTYRVIDGAYLDRRDGVESTTGAGAALGGAGGFLIGLGTVAIPGAGPLLVVGSILVSVIAGMSVGALTGGAIGILLELGYSREQAERMGKLLGEGQVLILVKASSHSKHEIRNILLLHSPVSVTIEEPTRATPSLL